MSGSSTPVSNSLPQWLKCSQSSSYMNSILDTLRRREITRDRARNSSRNRSKPEGRAHRASRRISDAMNIHISPEKLIDHYSIAVGNLPENQGKNRYYQLEPYDRTRVVVGEETGSCNSARRGRYLNASWVRERFGEKWWIANQAPLPSTAHAFLSIIIQPISCPPVSLRPHSVGPELQAETSRVRTVVQLTQNVESGRLKAHAYFPFHIGMSTIVPPEPGCSNFPLKVTLVDNQGHQDARCIESTISVVPVAWIKAQNRHKQDDDIEEDELGVAFEFGEEVGDPVVFKHLLYVAWPDHGIPEPEDRASLLAFLRLVDRVNKELPPTPDGSISKLDPDPPIMAGCSAGIGRTGSFIALSSLLRFFNLLDPSTSLASPETRPTQMGSGSIFSSLFRKRSSSMRSSSLPSSVSLPPSPLGPLPDDFKDDLVIHEIDALREQRPGMVQRDEQVQLIYEVLATAFLE